MNCKLYKVLSKCLSIFKSFLNRYISKQTYWKIDDNIIYPIECFLHNTLEWTSEYMVGFCSHEESMFLTKNGKEVMMEYINIEWSDENTYITNKSVKKIVQRNDYEIELRYNKKIYNMFDNIEGYFKCHFIWHSTNGELHKIKDVSPLTKIELDKYFKDGVL